MGLEGDRAELGVWGRGPVVPVPASGVDGLVGARVVADPARVAVRCGLEVLTYAELWERSGRLAGHLRARGVRAGDLVGVAVERSVAMVVAVLAVWRVGAAYVPLDPGFPAERLCFMVSDSGLGVVVTSGWVAGLAGAGVEVVDLVGDAAVIETADPVVAVDERGRGLCDVHVGFDRVAQGGRGDPSQRGQFLGFDGGRAWVGRR